jgi:Tol biopolymer transport system component
MPLDPGTRLGAHEIVGLLGAGGMGEVYRATDTRLKRDVAVKVLPEAFAGDSDRMARFQREAELLASLNHPNIAGIYGLEQADPSTGSGQAPMIAIVLELVEGETLADIIARGPIAVVDALPIAHQIAEALEAAHEKGVVHRDLKPANIKITAEGRVKVLDFGLAKMLDPAEAGGAKPSAMSMSPTLSVHATYAGVILGTAAYMSPEQARGKPVDRRTDIWSFGCVLFEMLAARQTFEGGETVTDTIAAIIKNEPDWTVLPGDTPPHIRALLKRCLQKDPKRRLRDIGDARLEIEEGATGAGPAQSDVAQGFSAQGRSDVAKRRLLVPWIVASVAALVAAALAAVILGHREPRDPGAVHFSITAPEGMTIGHSTPQRGAKVPAAHYAPSPDGRRLAYVMYKGDDNPQLWVRRLDAASGQALPGTDDASFPFWSPDGRFIAFFAQGRLKKVDANGGAPQTICDAAAGEGGTWNATGDIVFTPDETSGLFKVSASGGEPTAVTTLDAARGETSHRWPQFLPDGRHYLYLARTEKVKGAPSGMNAANDAWSIYAGSLGAADRTLVVRGVVRAVYASGHLMFVRDTTLMAQAFDANALRLTGEPVPVAEEVPLNVANARSGFAVADTVLAYRHGAAAGGTALLTWFDRNGKRLDSVAAPDNYAIVRLSPDGRMLAAYKTEGSVTFSVSGDLWTLDLTRGGVMSRLTFTADQPKDGPLWSPDSSSVVFGSGTAASSPQVTDLYRKRANGVSDAELLLKGASPVRPTSWSSDGRYVAFNQTDRKGHTDIWLLPMYGDRKPVPFLQTSFDELNAAFSPDGRWIAYQSDKGGAFDVYVRPFPSGDREWRISQNGGEVPHWRADGRELFFIPRGAGIMAAPITLSPVFEPGVPVKLFDVALRFNFNYGAYSVSPDGQRFLVIDSSSVSQTSGAPTIEVVVNWPAGLRK